MSEAALLNRIKQIESELANARVVELNYAWLLKNNLYWCNRREELDSFIQANRVREAKG